MTRVQEQMQKWWSEVRSVRRRTFVTNVRSTATRTVTFYRMLPLNSRAHFFLSRLSSRFSLPTLCSTGSSKDFIGWRPYSSHAKFSGIPEHLATCFSFWPNFLSLPEQRVLLTAALQRLDSLDSARLQRKRSKLQPQDPDPNDIQSIFAPDTLYDFAEVFTHIATKRPISTVYATRVILMA